MQFRAEGITMFGSHSKKTKITAAAANSIRTAANPPGEPVKTHSQVQKDNRKKKITGTGRFDRAAENRN